MATRGTFDRLPANFLADLPRTERALPEALARMLIPRRRHSCLVLRINSLTACLRWFKFSRGFTPAEVCGGTPKLKTRLK